MTTAADSDVSWGWVRRFDSRIPVFSHPRGDEKELISRYRKVKGDPEFVDDGGEVREVGLLDLWRCPCSGVT